MVKIAIDARMLGPRLHGHARVIWATTEQLAAQSPQTRFVMLGDSGWARQLEATRQNVRVRPLPAPSFSLSEQWQLPAALLAERPTLYHATTTALPLFRPIPYVLTVQDLIPLILYGNQPRYRLYFGVWLAWAARRARRVIVSSEATRQDLIRMLGVPASLITVIPLGVQPAYHAQAEADERARLQARYGVSAPYILTCGNARPHKNLPRALALLEALLPRLDAEMNVVVLSAPGPLLDAAIARFSQPARLRHIAYVEEDDLPALYRQAHTFFYPSLLEGFGLPVAEAMACRAVVVSSGATSLAEVLGDGGLRVDVGDTAATLDALHAACTDEGLRSRLRDAAARQAATFSWTACAQATMEVYRAAIG